jgi:hypothetical protein
MPDNDYTRFSENARRLREHLEGMDTPGDDDIEQHVEEACNELTSAIQLAFERGKDD